MIAGQIIGVDRVLGFLGSREPEVAKNLKAETSRLAIALLRKVKEEKLSGQVLKNQTGTLRRSINQRVEASGTSVSGSVGTNLVYARAHEFGVDKRVVVTVREYLRRTKASFREAGKIGWRGKNRLALSRNASMGAALVHSFTRNQHIKLPERSFLRSALQEMAPEIREGLSEAIRKAMK